MTTQGALSATAAASDCREQLAASDWGALLVHLLVAFGSAVGRGPHLFVEDDRHCCNLYAMFVGMTGMGRKGTAGRRIRKLFTLADPEWAERCIRGGMTSGQRVVQAIRDPSETLDKYGDPYHQGVADKRLLLREEELAGMFRRMDRPDNTLVDVLRNGWDGINLYVLTKNDPMKVTNPHISIVGDITVDELQRLFRRIDVVNGFGNRFLCTKRSELRPYVGRRLAHPDLVELTSKLREALEVARGIRRVRLGLVTQLRWAEMYVQLAGDRPGLLGAATQRGAPQVLRLSMIYALLDGSAKVRPEHLKAAHAVWSYCRNSARYVFGVDKLLVAIRDGGEDGLDGTQIQALFGRHARMKDLNQALSQLGSAGLITRVTVKTGGRPKTRWIATQ